MPRAVLSDRGVVRVSGEDAARFLQGLVTCNVETLGAGEARYGALLTPQGKIVVDFLCIGVPADDGGGFLLDTPGVLAAELAKKLGFYRLRAKVAVEDLSAQLAVTAVWGEETAPSPEGLVARDPRHTALGWRLVGPKPAEAPAPTGDYEAHRIGLGIPAGGRDFAYGDAFPHEADMDQLAGVDFAKGCYVGQEVVSRMQHRGTARTRVVPVTFADFPPMEGLDVVAGDKQLGVMGSSVHGRGLAKLRLDRVAEAADAGEPITAGGIPLVPVKPDWARFAWPGETEA
ncbi:folate-binding protein [Phreatobacter sp.]|uniref:CAF17-like 4Fe-4S cluster assembly/insertion protein YgfZ n=1 Tax=Phreatobacter sp. TaxID=1966341 RepID=UPI0022C61327|nr:folate-binding protein [Phreatobacter sp.]MCZ8313916.1 folate-binding protein [Phreatobacter sp.]